MLDAPVSVIDLVEAGPQQRADYFRARVGAYYESDNLTVDIRIGSVLVSQFTGTVSGRVFSSDTTDDRETFGDYKGLGAFTVIYAELVKFLLKEGVDMMQVATQKYSTARFLLKQSPTTFRMGQKSLPIYRALLDDSKRRRSDNLSQMAMFTFDLPTTPPPPPAS